MVSFSVTVLAGISAILSTGIIGASAEPRWRPGPSRRPNPDQVETVTQFVTVAVYPETTAPGATATVTVTVSLGPPEPVSASNSAASTTTTTITITDQGFSASSSAAPTNTFVLSTLSVNPINTNSTVDLPTTTGPGNIITSLAPTVCPGLDETILETVWTTLFNTVTATVLV